MTSTTKTVGDTGRTAISAALLVSLAIAVAGCWIGASSIDVTPGWWGSTDTVSPAPAFWTSFIGIVARNVAASALLFSGVATAGVSTVLTLGLTSTYVGATFAGAVAQVGPGAVIGSIWLYAPLEFAAILLSAAAGLLPLAGMLQRSWRGDRTGSLIGHYSQSLGLSLRLFGTAVIVLIIAAIAEAALLASR